jgi:hypothetical protein
LAFTASPGFAGGHGHSDGNTTANAIAGSDSNANSNSTAISGSSSNSGVSHSGNSSSQSGVKNSGNSSSQSGVKNSGNSKSASNSQAANALNINETTPANQTIKNVPTVYAPGLAAAGAEVCLGSVSAGGAGAGFGLSIGGTYVDKECQLRLNAKTLAVLGYNVAAREEMCLDPEVRQAMLAAGTPCEADRAAQVVQARDEYMAPASSASSAPIHTPSEALSLASASSETAGPGCHEQYQLIGGWYEVCDKGGRQ